MILTGNTILITGGNSGIGRAMAEALHARSNQVIITGRNEATLRETTDANPGMTAYVVDMTDAALIATFAAQVTREHPSLNAVFLNAGIMKDIDVARDGLDQPSEEETVVTNLLGPMRLTAALLPHLRRAQGATIVTVSSGLAFVPVARAPAYCATKAAIHSWSQSLRHALKPEGIQVIEWVPPQVATELQPGQSHYASAMPLDDFIAESVALLDAHPDADEILVDRVRMLRDAEAEGRFDATFAKVNG